MLSLLMKLFRLGPTSDATSVSYRVAASQSIAPGSVASQSRVASVAHDGVTPGSVASESR